VNYAEFPGRSGIVQCLFYHLHKCCGHHLFGGGCSVDIDLVVDPDLGDCDNLEFLAQLPVFMTAVDQDCQFVAETCKSVSEPDRLGTESSVRGGKDADQNLLSQF
jgi:hypothetical protein